MVAAENVAAARLPGEGTVTDAGSGATTVSHVGIALQPIVSSGASMSHQSDVVTAARIAADAAAQTALAAGTKSQRASVYAAVIGAVGVFIAMIVKEWSEQRQAAVAAGVEMRLLDGIKARILQPERPPAFQPPQAGEASVSRCIAPMERAAASDLFKALERRFPIAIVIAPKVSS